jgi:uncharacterized HAD superfamily protein
MDHKGLRFNEGKLRYDLVHPFAHEEMVKVLTMGANKYEPRNWEKGMLWSNVISSLKRHLAAIEKGEDFDNESGLLHASHLACNAHFLTAYYKIYPQGDDRQHNYLSDLKIGLDIDEVLCGWVGAWCKEFNIKIPEVWSFSYSNKEKFKELSESGKLNDFYLNLPRIVNPSDLPFEPHCYITSRSVPIDLTMRWLENNGFPCKTVYSVGFGESKIDAAKSSGIDIFIDDYYSNFVQLNKAGICTYLWDAPHNQRYNVGYKRIFNFDNFK